jgi:hypothetical protein
MGRYKNELQVPGNIKAQPLVAQFYKSIVMSTSYKQITHNL